MTVKEQIWNYFLNKGFSPYGIASMMGNMQVESKFIPNNLEDGRLPYNDAQYTAMVDNGTYKNFVNDGCGYGIVQWTYSVFKDDLLKLCRSRGKSIGDLQCQLDQLYNHLKSEGLYNTIKNSTSIDETTIYFLTKFEKPKVQNQKVKEKRIKYAKEIFNEFYNKGGNKMKYSANNPPLICMQTNSTCYKQTSKMQVKGVLWHSTGANNPYLKRYVQPSDNDPNKAILQSQIGINTARNDWNHISMQAGLNAWVGKLEGGAVTSVQTMPWDYKPWGCGSGSKGSCNNGWIQFEICEDSLSDKNYFDKIYQEACELTAYLCKIYNLNPKGSTSMNGIAVPVILCHQDSAQLGLGSNHADIYHWFTKFGKNMNTVRNDVAKLLGNSGSSSVTQSIPSVNPTSTMGRDLGRGDSGSDVKQLQEKLLKLGYNLGSYGADGDYGSLTEVAVLDIQRKYNLTQDGMAGPTTMKVIDNLLSQNSTPSTSTPAADEIYRIRTSWTDIKTQIGAYKKLENAIEACKKLGSSYKVFNNKGEVVYPTSGSSVPVQNTIKPKSTYSNVVIGSASKDENGQYRGGNAGDQTNREVYILNWYDGGWNYVLRPNSSNLSEKIASCCEDACNNNNVGYDQYQRNTLLQQAKIANMNIAKISTPCECDCASLVSTCCVCAGLPENIFFPGGNGCTTNNLKSACERCGQFTVLNSNNYTKSKDYLQRGDILLADGHTVIVLQSGNKVNNLATITTTVETYKVRVTAEKKLNVRSGPGTNYAIITQVANGGVFTIIEEREGWGKLKSGAGWVDLKYTQRI